MKKEPLDPEGLTFLPRAARQLSIRRNPKSAAFNKTQSRDEELAIMEEYQRAKVELFDAVRKGRVHTVYLHSNGEFESIPLNWWLPPGARDRVEHGLIDPDQPLKPGPGTNWIFANEDDLQRLWLTNENFEPTDPTDPTWAPSEYLQFMIDQSRRLQKPNVSFTKEQLAEKLLKAWDSTHPHKDDKLGKTRSEWMASFLLKTNNKGRGGK